MILHQELLGITKDREKVEKFALSNSKGLTAAIMNLGGILISFKMPDRTGAVEEITLGFDTLDEYLAGHPYFGAIIGRFANPRICDKRCSRLVFLTSLTCTFSMKLSACPCN